MSRWITLATLLMGASAAALPAADPSPRYTGQPLMRVFTERETGGTARNHAIAVHPTGLIYAANDVGLREFDGATWRAVAGTERRMIFNVAIDAAGRVFYCGPQHFGVLVPSTNGTLTAQPLHLQLPEPDRELGDVREVVALGSEAYFNLGLRRALARVDAQGGVHLIPLPAAAHFFAAWAGAVYAATAQGVFRLESGTAVPEPTPPLGLSTRSRGRIPGVWPRAEGGAWVLARDGLHVWEHGDTRRVSDEIARLLGADTVVSGCPIGDGTFALGTRTHGLLIVGPDGRLLARYGEETGLGPGSDYVEGLTMDGDGGLWVAHDGGVTRVEVRNPGALHGPPSGLRSRQVFALALHRGRLHVGTSQGVTVRDPASGRFTPLRGLPGNIGSLLSTEEGLIVTANRLVLFRDDGSLETIDDAGGGFLSVQRFRRDPDRLLATTHTGLRVYRRSKGRWQHEGTVAAVRGRLIQLTQDDAGWLWAVREPTQILRIDWRPGLRFDATVEIVGGAHGLPPNATTPSAVQLLVMGGALTIASRGSLLRHDAATDRFEPETRITGLPPADATHQILALGNDEFLFTRVGGPARLGLIHPSGPDRWVFRAEPVSGFESISPRVALVEPATRTLWFASQQLASYDLDRPRLEIAPPAARVRRVTDSEQTELWNGSGPTSEMALSREQNGLQFSYAAPSPQTNPRGLLLVGYRTRLDGFDRGWSPWSLGTSRSYTNLPPGAYEFRVQAAGPDYRQGPEATWAFRILPPWWHTWWFLSFAGLAGIGSVAGVTRWVANRALRRRLERLEAQSAVERERLRLARDLHDEVGSGLGRVILFAGEARDVQGDAGQLNAALDRVRDSAQELVQHTRQIVWAVSPQHDPLASVIERLADYVEETLRAAGIACQIDVPAAGQIPGVELGSEARHNLFLATKEAVHNCVKYSAAQTAELRLHLAAGYLVLTLRDHGRGFAAGEIRGTGHGLPSLAARAQALGGTFEISSAAGTGTTVTLRVPVSETPHRPA